MAHDASATWSGFNYQGKIALFHTLRIIEEKLQHNLNFDFNGYELIVEQHEDFDIKQPDGYVSFHQVKALNTQNISSYKNALLAMVLELCRDENKSVAGQLHVWKEIDLSHPTAFVESVRENITEIIAEYEQASDKSTTFIGKAIGDASNKPKQAKIIRNFFVDETCAETILEQLQAILNDDNSPLRRISIYDYSNNECFCPLETIREKVIDKIDAILTYKQLPTAGEINEKLLCKLLGIVDEHIVQRHNNLNQQAPESISFSSLLENIVDQSINDTSEEFLAERFKLYFIEQFEQYIVEPEYCGIEDYENYVNGEQNNLQFIFDLLIQLPALELWKYHQSHSPHLILQGQYNIDSALQSNLSQIQDSLFEILNRLGRANFQNQESRKRYLYNCGKGKFLPTTIALGKVNALSQGILKNPFMIENLFEVSTLIAGNSVSPIRNFELAYDNIADISVDEYYIGAAPRAEEKISDIVKNLRLIRLDEAEQEINNA